MRLKPHAPAMAPRRGLIRWIAALVLVAATLSWPGVVNGGPFWFPDTSAYVRGADAAVVALTGNRSAWSDRILPALPPEASSGKAGRQVRISAERLPLKGRSIYYGALLYALLLVGGPWLALFGQCLIVSALLLICARPAMRALLGSNDAPDVCLWPLVGVVAATAASTSLSYYTAMLMPDVFAGLGILIAASLPLFAKSTLRWERDCLVLAVCAIAAFHSANLLIIMAVGAAAFAFAVLTGDPPLRRLWVYTVVLAAAPLSSLAFSRAVETILGQPPISPPFLTARMIAAGPGVQLLRERCPNYPGPLCALAYRFPQDSDTLLWSNDPKTGMFMAGSAEDKRQLASGDQAFFFDVVKHYPIEVLRVSCSAVLRQVTAFGLDNFNYSELHRRSLNRNLPAQIISEVRRTKAFRGEMPATPWIATTLLISVVAACALLVLGLRAALRGDAIIFRFTTLALAGVLINAAICGAFSKPHERYQMRLIWLLPLAACLAALPSQRTQRKEEPR